MYRIFNIFRLIVITIPILSLFVGRLAIGEDDSSPSLTLEEKAANILSPDDWFKMLSVEESIELFHQFLNETLDLTGELQPGVEGNLFSTKVDIAAQILPHYYEFHRKEDLSGLIEQWGEPVQVYQVNDASLIYNLSPDSGITMCYEYPDKYVWQLQSNNVSITFTGTWKITPRSDRLDSYLKKYVFGSESPKIIINVNGEALPPQ